MKWQKEKITGYLLILAASGFAASWFLMPDPGTTDTAHILDIVKQSRTEVLCSVIIQIITSMLYLVTLFVMTRNRFVRKTTIAGMILLGIGVMGFCADAFFHLLAYGMTGDNITIGPDLVMVMDFMQTTGVVLLTPILLPFFIGSLMMVRGMQRQGLVSCVPQLIFLVAILTGVIYAVLISIGVYDGQMPVMVLIGLYAIGQIWCGAEMATAEKQQITVLLENRKAWNFKTETN